MRHLPHLGGLAFLSLLIVSFTSTAYAGGYTPGDTNIYRLYNPTTGDHFYTASIDEKNSNSCLSPSDYIKELSGPAFYGYVSPEGNHTAVFRLYDPRTKKHFLTSSENEHSAVVRAGMVDEGISFFADQTPQTAEVPVFRLYKPSTGDHLFTSSVGERATALSVAGNTYGTVFIDEGVAFYANLTADSTHPTAYLPVWRMLNGKTDDHAYVGTTERDMIGCHAPQYKYEGIAFAAFLPDVQGKPSVIRYYNPKTGFHFYTPSGQEGTNAVTAGYVSEGSAFSVLPSVIQYTSSRLFSQSKGYLYTGDPIEVTAAIRSGFSFEALAFPIDAPCTYNCTNP